MKFPFVSDLFQVYSLDGSGDLHTMSCRVMPSHAECQVARLLKPNGRFLSYEILVTRTW